MIVYWIIRIMFSLPRSSVWNRRADVMVASLLTVWRSIALVKDLVKKSLAVAWQGDVVKGTDIAPSGLLLISGDFTKIRRYGTS